MTAPSRMCNFGCCMACRAPLLPGDIMLIHRECVRVYLINAQFFALQSDLVPCSQFSGFIEMSHVIPHAQRHAAIRFAWSRVERTPVDTGPFALEPAGPRGVNFDTLDDANSVLFASKQYPSTEYRARWDPPTVALPLQPLLALVLRLAGDRATREVNLDLVYPCCSHCNDIMDSSARIGWMCIEGLVPEKSVYAYGKTKRDLRVRPDRAVKNYQTDTLGAMVGYYLQRCLLNFESPGLDYRGTHASARKVFVALCFVILNLVAVWLERRKPLSKSDSPKGAHIYDGVLNLLTGHCLYLLFLLGPHGQGVDFSRFYLFYMLELVDAPVEIWEQDATTLYAPLFKGSDSGDTADVGGLISSVAARLAKLYDFPVRRVCKFMLGLRPARYAERNKDKWAAIKAFFLTHNEAGVMQARHEYCRQFSASRRDQDISRFIQNVGVFPVLWPVLRSLVVEDQRYRHIVYRWIAFERDIECEAIVTHNQHIRALDRDYHSARVREDNALLLFNLQFLLRPKELFGNRTVLEAMGHYALPDIRRRASGMPFCSIWKATIRHARLQCLGGAWFARQAPAAPMASRLLACELGVKAASAAFTRTPATFTPASAAFTCTPATFTPASAAFTCTPATFTPASASPRGSAPAGCRPGSPSRPPGARRASCEELAPLLHWPSLLRLAGSSE